MKTLKLCIAIAIPVQYSYLFHMTMHMVDGPNLLPYTTQIRDVKFNMCPQMYLKESGSIPKTFGSNLKLLNY